MPHWWIQADCVLMEAETIGQAYQQYRDDLARFQIGCSQGRHCAGLRYYAQVNPEKYAQLLAQQDGE